MIQLDVWIISPSTAVFQYDKHTLCQLELIICKIMMIREITDHFCSPLSNVNQILKVPSIIEKFWLVEVLEGPKIEEVSIVANFNDGVNRQTFPFFIFPFKGE